MMKKYLVYVVVLVMGVASCGNKQDYAYNEKMAVLFYNCKEKLDYNHKKLMAGDFDKDTSNKMFFEMVVKEASALGTYCNEMREEAAGIPHSEAANAFHAAVTGYMSQISVAYTPLLVQYVTQQDAKDRDATRLQLIARKQALGALEDKCLEAQVVFLDQAGIKINQESIKR